MDESSKLHVFCDATDWFVAENIEDLERVVAEHYELTLDSTYEKERGASAKDSFYQLNGNEILGIFDEDDLKVTRKTNLQWAKENGRGFLCSTEW